MATGKHHAYILQGADGQYKVRPSVATLQHKSGKNFSICNVSGLPAQVKINPAYLQNGEPDVADVGDGNFVEFELLKQRPGKSISFSYKVRVETGDWGTLPVCGESDPVIIIDP